jgi:translation initiation factor IF-1
MTGHTDIHETVCGSFVRSRNIHISGTILQILVKKMIKLLGENKKNIIGFEVLTAVTMKGTIFCDVLPHSMVEMAVNFYCTTWAHIPKDSTLQAEHV